MLPKKLNNEIYSKKLYWYHLSTLLTRKHYILHPRNNDEGFNRAEDEPDIPLICVSPSIEQCLVALPYDKYDTYYIYRTKDKVIANFPREIFDSSVTQEGWITVSTPFNRIGVLKFKNIITPTGKKRKLKCEVASDGNLTKSKQLYSWWNNLDVHKFITWDSP